MTAISVPSLDDPQPSRLRTQLALYPHLLSHTCSFSVSEIWEIQIHLVLSDGKIVYHRQRRQGPGGAAALINGNPLILG